MIEVYSDGGCRLTRPDKLGAWAFLILVDGDVADRGCGTQIGTTVNRMEYTALIKGLSALKAINVGGHKVKIMSDSQLLVNQVTGNWKVNDPILKRLRLNVLKQGKLALGDSMAEFIWNPRESEWTVECDRMCNEVMDKVQR